MGIAKTILTVVYFIIAIAMIILALIQNKRRWRIIINNNRFINKQFLRKNKGRTKRRKNKKMDNNISYIICNIINSIRNIIYGIKNKKQINKYNYEAT